MEIFFISDAWKRNASYRVRKEEGSGLVREQGKRKPALPQEERFLPFEKGRTHVEGSFLDRKQGKLKLPSIMQRRG